MDTEITRRGRRESTKTQGTTKQKKCRYCKGLFTPNPNQAKHDFCQTSCRKDFHKYGAFPVAKFKADLEQKFARMLQTELAPIRARLDALEKTEAYIRFSTAAMDWERAKRGGGAAA